MFPWMRIILNFLNKFREDSGGRGPGTVFRKEGYQFWEKGVGGVEGVGGKTDLAGKGPAHVSGQCQLFRAGGGGGVEKTSGVQGFQWTFVLQAFYPFPGRRERRALFWRPKFRSCAQEKISPVRAMVISK